MNSISDDQPASDESQKEFKSVMSASKYTPKLSHRSKTLKNLGRKTYVMTQSAQKELKLKAMSLKFVTVNMLSLCLQVIDLSFNKIVVIPNEITEICRLKILKLNNNELVSMPKDTFRLTSLTHLVLSNNKLKVLPA